MIVVVVIIIIVIISFVVLLLPSSGWLAESTIKNDLINTGDHSKIGPNIVSENR